MIQVITVLLPPSLSTDALVMQCFTLFRTGASMRYSMGGIQYPHFRNLLRFDDAAQSLIVKPMWNVNCRRPAVFKLHHMLFYVLPNLVHGWPF